MKIKSISAKNFRNLKNPELRFGEESVLAFAGANGQGKTNLLEAIYLCALSKSFHTRINADLISFDHDFCSVNLRAEIENDEKELDVIITENPAQKVMKINGVKKKAAQFIGTLKAVFFSPDDLSQMAFAPRLRRRYLDVLLTQLDRNYLEDLMKYQEALRQRNALLKKIGEGKSQAGELDFWDEKLADLGLAVIQKRTDLILSLQELLKKEYSAISQNSDSLQIIYKSEVADVANSDELLEKIRKGRDRDIASGSTRLGPHRDDLQFLINNHDMVFFASRGEWRSLVLALKFAEIRMIEEKTGQRPILLLDDVFSELDETRQKYLFSAIKNTQTFITTTHKEFIDQLDVPVKVYEVEGGNFADLS